MAPFKKLTDGECLYKALEPIIKTKTFKDGRGVVKHRTSLIYHAAFDYILRLEKYIETNLPQLATINKEYQALTSVVNHRDKPKKKSKNQIENVRKREYSLRSNRLNSSYCTNEASIDDTLELISEVISNQDKNTTVQFEEDEEENDKENICSKLYGELRAICNTPNSQ